MSKVSVSPITNGQNLSAINQNFSTLADALNDGALWRQNPPVEPNQMLNDLDMNGKNVLNVGLIDAQDFTIAGSSFDEGVIETVEAAAAVAVNAAAQATAAASQATTVVAGALQANNNLSDVQSIATAKLNLNLVKADVGLGNADNTSDVNKPISTATQTALDLKAPLTTPNFNTTVTVKGAAGIARGYYLYTNATARWAIEENGGTESGSNAGSDFALSRYNDAGTFIETVLSIPRATGVPSFTKGIIINGNNINLNGAQNTSKSIFFGNTGNVGRWSVFADSVTESGSNAGCDFHISRYNDAGTFIDNPITIERSTGTVSIKGRGTNVAPSAGTIGEILTSTASGTSITSSSQLNAVTLGLTAGVWDVSGVVNYIPAATTNFLRAQQGISTTSNTMAGLGSFTTYFVNATNSGNPNHATPTVRISLSGSANVYVVVNANFTVSTMTCDGFIRAIRVA